MFLTLLKSKWCENFNNLNTLKLSELKCGGNWLSLMQ